MPPSSETRSSPRLFETRPLDGSFGAELTGIDLSAAPTPAVMDALLSAWRQHLVLVVRDQHLGPDQLLNLSRAIGKLDLAPAFDQEKSNLDGYPEIAVVSNVEKEGRAIGGLGHGELAWHSDMTYRREPPVACALYAVEVPPTGGDTHFLNMVASREALPSTLETRVKSTRLLHDASYTSAGTRRQPGEGGVTVDHPVITKDPLSGKECLLLGRRRGSGVVGLDENQGAALVEDLWHHADREAFVTTQHWRSGDLVLWANMAVMHRRDAFDGKQNRILHRAQIARLN